MINNLLIIEYKLNFYFIYIYLMSVIIISFASSKTFYIVNNKYKNNIFTVL